MRSRTNRDAGFTLVEMLVALAIFALLAAGGVTLLRSSVDGQALVTRKLDQVDSQQRVIALFTADIGQAIARPLDGIGAARQPPFDGQADRVALMRAGWANPDGRARSTLQRVEWGASAEGLERTAFLFLSGAEKGQPALLGKPVAAVRFRYRRVGGEWVSSFRSAPGELMPAAVEMVVTPPSGAPLTIIAALPPRGLEPSAPAKASAT